MFKEICVVHQAKTGGLSKDSFCSNEGWILWHTCLRSVAIHHGFNLEKAAKGIEIYQGAEAYQFFLEIICGVHSPIQGETEIFGQFRQYFFENPCLDFHPCLKKFFAQLLRDAKKIRHDYLTHLGNQSYGSFLRKKMKGVSDVHLIGTGQLTQSILPWIVKNDARVFIYCRDSKKVNQVLSMNKKVTLCQLDLSNLTSKKSGALIIAAPLGARELSSWHHHKFEQVVDFRGESQSDPLWGFENLIALKDIFQEIKGNQQERTQKIAEAMRAIQNCTAQLFQKIEHHPFGWEDLCA
jgi:glutamyl-tRNA reductase